MPDCYLKFSKEESHLKDFVENGHIYVNTAEYFTNCEDEVIGQNDKFELITSYHQHEGASLELDGRKFNIIRPFVMREGNPECSHIFCLYALSKMSISRSENGKVFNERLWNEFGNYFVLIHDARSFSKMLDSKLKELDLPYKSGCIEYFCPNTHEGPVGAFRKRDVFSHQEEYRVAINRPDIKGPISDLYLGSLKNIAYGPVHRDKSINSHDDGKAIL